LNEYDATDLAKLVSIWYEQITRRQAKLWLFM